MSKAEHMDISPAQESTQTRKNSSPKHTTSEQTHGFGSESVRSEPSEQKHQIASENVQNEPAETSTVVSNSIVIEQLGPPPEDATKNSLVEELGPPPEDVTKNSSTGHLGSPPEDAAKNSSIEQLGPLPKDAIDNSSWLGLRDKRTSAKLLKRKYTLRSSVDSSGVLRSRSQEIPKAPEPSNILEHVSSGREKYRKKKKRMRKILRDEFSRIRKHLRYLLNRISYEQSLIDAYSAEGWKGQSLEKLKPEKELQRAKSEIFRRKLKIRDLFHHLDSLCAEGRFPESLFDSEGQICSEDIFCAKCGSKDLSVDNDIILCDGTCERGFHQLCLEPPLLKIPPGDEGWLCPGCDCKVDCTDLLNDSQGTNLSISDSWEKVFPEAAAAAAAGNKHDDGFGFPSDDSEDNDYDPDGPEVDEKVQGDESSSSESDFTSASDDLGPSPNDEQYPGLPSDDSEDDDYEPNAPDLDEQVKQESSSSDFTSDSQDLSDAFDDERSSGKDEGPVSSSLDDIQPFSGSDGRRSKLGGKKKQPLNDELLPILESNPAQDDSGPVSGKRHIERLDYKKLHDEAYGNVPSDSSEDEDWTDTVAPRKRKNATGKVAPVSINGNAQIIKNGTNTKDIKHNVKETEHTPNRRTRQKLDFEDANNSPAKSHNGSPRPGSSGRKATRSAYRRLGEAVTQRLYKSFKENQYPDRAMKENMAKELGITSQQVSKWFENARWSFRHPSFVEASTAEKAPNKDTSSPQINKKPLELEPRMATRDAACNGVENKESPKAGAASVECCSGDGRERKLATEESGIQKSATPNSRKRKGKLDHRASDQVLSVLSVEETPKPPGDLSSAQEVQGSGRIQTRSRKSVA